MPKRYSCVCRSHPSARNHVATAILILSCALPCLKATPAYFSTVANQVLRMQGGSRLGGDLNVHAIYQLEQQVKRVMGADPAQGLNVSALRDVPETELLRVLFLAVLGNFTSAAASEWNRPCSLVVNPTTGLVGLADPPPMETLALKVVLVLLVAVQVRQWVMEIRAQKGGAAGTGEGLSAMGIVLPPRDHARKGI